MEMSNTFALGTIITFIAILALMGCSDRSLFLWRVIGIIGAVLMITGAILSI